MPIRNRQLYFTAEELQLIKHVGETVSRKARDEARRRDKQVMRDDAWVFSIAVISLLVLLLLDGYAINHGQQPMLFGR